MIPIPEVMDRNEELSPMISIHKRVSIFKQTQSLKTGELMEMRKGLASYISDEDKEEYEDLTPIHRKGLTDNSSKEKTPSLINAGMSALNDDKDFVSGEDQEMFKYWEDYDSKSIADLAQGLRMNSPRMMNPSNGPLDNIMPESGG